LGRDEREEDVEAGKGLKEDDAKAWNDGQVSQLAIA